MDVNNLDQRRNRRLGQENAVKIQFFLNQGFRLDSHFKLPPKYFVGVLKFLKNPLAVFLKPFTNNNVPPYSFDGSWALIGSENENCLNFEFVLSVIFIHR